MNTKRILSWGGFVIVVGLIVWGLIVAANKAEREGNAVASVDEVTSSDWVKGATSSAVTLIEYSDFQCPACGSYFPVVERLLLENPQVRFVYRHFPLQQHVNAFAASQASEAAGEQGKFWEMHETLFTNQTAWEISKTVKTIFEGYAQDLGLDMDKFKNDYSSKEISDKINTDLKSGLKAGINSTPTFYLNGKKIQQNGYEEFKKLISDASATSTNP
ncbi:MAG TPA: thioredoxin domain-containing protein [Candidatus Paceibacterota bacterium]